MSTSPGPSAEDDLSASREPLVPEKMRPIIPKGTYQRAQVEEGAEENPSGKESGSDLMEEIRLLRVKLSVLGNRVANQMGDQPERSQDGDENSGMDTDTMEGVDPIEGSQKTRKRCRRAGKGAKWVDKRESRAMQLGRTEREDKENPRLNWIGENGEEDFVVHLVPSDEEGKQYWPSLYKGHRFGPSRISTTTRRLAPTRYLQKSQSRKLGPPTQWDTSDSDQWDSDDSTKTQDFNYFRARLRGDFEWEIERLMAQKARYIQYKEKQKEIALASKGRNYTKTPQDPGESSKDALLRISQCTWTGFEAMWDEPLETASAIDVLLGEPQVKATKMMDDGSLRSKYQRQKVKMQRTPDTEPGAGYGLSFPERIRIHSIQIIKILSGIRGAPLNPPHRDGKPVVLLRPFRLLMAYGAEIRNLHSELTERSEASMEEPKTENQTEDQTGPVTEIESKESIKEKADHLACLIEFMDNYIVKRQAYLDSPACNKVLFSDLWHLFKPGDFVFSSNGKQVYQVFRVDLAPHRGVDPWAAYYQSPKRNDSDSENDKDSENNYIKIRCVHISFDGHELGPVISNFTIDSFNGERAVTSLDVYPLRLHHQKIIGARASKLEQDGPTLDAQLAKLRENLINRGRHFVEVAGVKHKYYAGLTVGTRDEVESQVMIDFQEAFAVEKHKIWMPKMTRLAGQPEVEQIYGCVSGCCESEFVYDDSSVDNSRYRDFIERLMPEISSAQSKPPSVTVFPRSLKDITAEGHELTDDELLIMSYKVPGFVLRDRTWAWLDLDYLSDVVSSAEDSEVNAASSDDEEDDHGAFSQLVLPDGHKTMVLSLVSQHFRNKRRTQDKDEQTDIVRGKGKGLIILLHGAPGVGKTTTAEGVAEKFKKPLFQITCGDLGTNATEVETALQTNFSLANKWDCVLLLDEADVFLAERRRNDFHRNGLVAVFLRVLEYYAGILFLTTNRIGDFDEAFASRIHMSLHYPQLNEISTMKIFKLNFRLIKTRYALRNRKIKIDEDEIIHTAGAYWREEPEARWNGRQIRNACQTALALAEYEAQPEGAKFDLTVNEERKVHLTVAYLNKVTRAYLDFMKYLKAVHGTDADRRARENGLRALESMAAAFASKEAVHSGNRGGDGLGGWNPAPGAPQMQQMSAPHGHQQSWNPAPSYGQGPAYTHQASGEPRSAAGARNYDPRGYPPQQQTQPAGFSQEQPQ